MDKKAPDEFIIRSPEEEYVNYIQQQIDIASRFEDAKKVKLYKDSFELGLKILNSIKKS